MSDVLEKYTEIVAAATREVSVAEALIREYQGKLRMAEEEASAADRRLSEARHGLEKAVLARYESTHGKRIEDNDRAEFEQRWESHLEALLARKESYRRILRPLDDMVSEQMLEGVEAEWAAKGPITEAEAQTMTVKDFESQVKVRGVIAMVG